MTEHTCNCKVAEPPGYWHSHRCARRTRYIITTKDGKQRAVCGIHYRMHERNPLHSAHFMAGVK